MDTQSTKLLSLENLANALDVLSKCNCLASLHQFCDYLTHLLSVEHFWFMIIPQYESKQCQQIITLNDYPHEFANPYVKNKRAKVDPVVVNSYQQKGKVLRWNELFDRTKLSEDEHVNLDWAAQNGIHDGLSYPVNGSYDEFVLLHLSIKKDSFATSELLNNRKLFLRSIIHMIYSKANNILCNEYLANYNKLTPREIDCLLWAARGKTIWETGKILKISQYTVRSHLENSIKKMRATNKVEASVKAVLFKQINVTDIISYFHDQIINQES